jgi:beta-glucanase (GH16 family)
MKPFRVVISCFLGLLVFSAKSAAGDWQLVWSDEFDSPGLADKAKWTYESGFVRNNELQFYTTARSENARVENGCLVIEGRKERFPNPFYRANASQENRRANAQFANYTSASLTTEGKFSFQYGRIEVRAKLPQGRGVWPAIWMLGTSMRSKGWPSCGETDIMEFVGKEPKYVHATMHFSKDGRHASKGDKLAVAQPWADFHTYTVEWTSERMDFYFDDQKYFSFDVDAAGTGADNPFRQPQYLILNLALGGSWGGEMDDSILPQRYLIDYVRCYKPKNS